MTFKPLLIDATIDGATATLTAPLTYTGKTDTFVIPAGFSTDFASVPQYCSWLIPKMGTYTRAAVLHDWLCTQLETWHRTAGRRPQYVVAVRKTGTHEFLWRSPASARDTDGIFRRVMREEGVPFVRRWLMWTGVRWGALGTPARRPGWIRDAWRVVLITVLAAPLVVPISVLCLVGAAVDNLVEGIR